MSTHEQSVDLNSDLGEGFGPWKMGDDDAILEVVSSANVACGMHAGDPHIMAQTFARAKQRGVSVGAHPGYPDLAGFGRRQMECSTSQIEEFVAYQVGAAIGVSRYVGHPITYVKPHGALANLSQVNAEIAGAIVRGIAGVDKSLVLLTYPDGHATRIAQEMGMRTCAEIFADRAYTSSGQLVSRKLPGAVLHDPEMVADRVLRMVRAGGVETVEGAFLPMEIGSICVHGDTPGAIQMATRVRDRLTGAGIKVCSFT